MRSAGTVAARPVDPARDAALLHDWLTRPYAHFWDMQEATVDDVRAAYDAVAADPGQHAFLGELDGRTAWLAELYDPAGSELAGRYDLRPGDLGMHFLTAPPDGPRIPGFTRRVMTDVMRLAFADPAVERVVVEPDLRNTRVQTLNAAVGFRVLGELDLGHKVGLLSVCERDAFRPAVAR